MLVLTRKERERLIIDERIVITVVRVAGGAVRLGIEAPLEVPIRREELVLAGNKSAAMDCQEAAQTTA
jgi:carbon storage regulator